MADHGNYLVATVYWWADNMKMEKEKEKENKNLHMITEFLHLLYSTYERAPVVFYYTSLYWNGYTNKDS